MTRGLETISPRPSACSGRELEVDQGVLAEDRQADAAGRVCHRQVDVVAVQQRRRLHREGLPGILDVLQAGIHDRVGAGAAAGHGDQARLATVTDPGGAHAHAEIAAEVVVRHHDAGLDEHLPHRDVERGHQAAHVGDPLRRVVDQQRVGALVDADAAAIGEQRAGARARAPEQVGEVGGLRVVDLQEFRTQRRELLDVLLRLELLPLAGRDLRGRRHQHHVAHLAHPSPLVVRMMSIAWSQGTLSSRRVTLPRTESLTTTLSPLVSASSCSTARTSMSWKFSVRRWPVYSLRSSKGPNCVGILLLDRAELDGELVIGLVGQLLVVAAGVDDQARAARIADAVHRLHRRREIEHVEAAQQCVGQEALRKSTTVRSSSSRMSTGIEPDRSASRPPGRRRRGHAGNPRS
jgi:hypothetical protein